MTPYPRTTPRPTSADHLHRRKNRKAANDTCVDVWGPYDGTKLNCDEYPFASTYEGPQREIMSVFQPHADAW
ncbi:NucA/NucB deoxyribonuclease domain-containing protein [Streptomyces globisporus]|uniref:NucA/NucB deoxyribonuclease domain-containing protein n=1 Tax=Streptomyces globisporus TaxID=1908 RepID=UPI001901A91A